MHDDRDREGPRWRPSSDRQTELEFDSARHHRSDEHHPREDEPKPEIEYGAPEIQHGAPESRYGAPEGAARRPAEPLRAPEAAYRAPGGAPVAAARRSRGGGFRVGPGLVGGVLSAAVLLAFYVLMGTGDSRGPGAGAERSALRAGNVPGAHAREVVLETLFASLQLGVPPVGTPPPLGEGFAQRRAAAARDLPLEADPSRAVLAPIPQAPAPAAPAAPQAATPVPAARAPAAPAAGNYAVQLLAVSSAARAEQAWSTLVASNADLLGPLAPRVTRADLGEKGTVYRLRAGPIASEDEARELCASLSARGQGCMIVRN